MKKSGFILLLAVVGTSFILSCAKDDDESTPTTPSQSRTEQIAHTWVIQSVVVDSLGIDIWPFNPKTCQKDDLYIFEKDGNGNIDQGTNLCDSAGPQQDPFTWSWQNGENDLLIVFPDSTLTFTGIKFSGDQMTGKSDQVLDLLSTVTFKKK